MFTFGDAFCGALRPYIDKSQPHMAAWMVRDRRKGLDQFRFGRREGRGGIGHEEIYALDRVRARRSYERFDVTGVGDKRAIETNVRLRHVLRRVTLVDPSHTLKIKVHRVRGRRLFGASRLGGGELVVQCAGETGDDLVLHIEEIGARLVETLGPEMISRFGVD